MNKSPFATHHLKTTGIVVASVLAIAGTGLATYFTLNQIKPVHKTTQEAPAEVSTADAAREKAEELLQKGDTKGALASYKEATAAYKAAGNQTAAANTEMQTKIVESTVASDESAPNNTDQSRVVVGSQQ